MTTELADEVETIRKTFPILLHDEEFSDGAMHVSLRYSERGNIVEANLCWDCNMSLEDFVNNTCCNEYHLPIYLKDSITHQLYELVRERQLVRNDQITCDFFQSTFRHQDDDDEELKQQEEQQAHVQFGQAIDDYRDDDDDEEGEEDDDDDDDDDDYYDSEDNEDDMEQDNDEENNDEDYSEEEITEEEATESDIGTYTTTESTIIETEKHPMNFSQFYKVFHSSATSQITLTKVANDLKCVYQDKYQERDRGINQIQKEYVLLNFEL